METVVVTGIGLATALGDREMTWRHLLAGESAIALGQPFPELPPLPLARFPQLPEPPKTIAALSRALALAALQDAGLALPQPHCGIVIGSSRGGQGQWEEALRAQPAAWNPEGWLENLPAGAAAAAAAAVQSNGPVSAPAAACTTGLHAIARGAELMRAGMCDRVLVGAVELPVTPLTLAGFARIGAYAKTGCYPFARQREGLVLGEGGAVFLLEAASAARRRGAKIYGAVLGAGLTCDAHHCSAPDPKRQAAARAIKICCEAAGGSAIDYIHAHGTSTRLNDANEAALLADLGLANAAVSSTKGATGHTLGASGALGVAFCLLALRDRILPPCVGMGADPEFALNWVRAAQKADIDRALCLGFGFGGQNVAIVLGRVAPAPQSEPRNY